MNSFSQLDNFRVLKTLGSGYSGKVKLGQDMATGQSFALKILQPEGDNLQTLLQSLKHEFEILKELSHPTIVRMFDLKQGLYTSRKTGLQKSTIYAVIELAPAGEIFDFIFQTRGLDEDIAAYYFKTLVEAMVYLHGRKVTHRDLKPENLLLDSDFKLKLVDFGFATVVDPGKPNKTSLGTEKYMAPELLYKKKYDATKVDVFAAGVILFVMHSGYPPFNTATQHCQFYHKFVKDNAKFWEFHGKQGLKRNYSKEFKDLVNSMIALDFTQRPSFAEVLNHPWLQKSVDEQAVLERMAGYKARMEAEKALKQQQPSSGENRDEATQSLYEQLNEIELDGLRFDQLAMPESRFTRGAVFKTGDRDMLAKLVVRLALDSKATREDRKDKLVFAVGKEEDLVRFEVKFHQLAEDQVEVQFLRKTGPYFDFQRVKAELMDKLQENCYK